MYSPIEGQDSIPSAPVSVPSDDWVLTVTQRYLSQASAVWAERDRLNRQNTEMFLGRQDWSHKIAGQSAEFLPVLTGAVEQITAFVKRALVELDDWFSVEATPNGILSGDQIRSLLLGQLNTLRDAGPLNFITLMSDAVKLGVLQSLVILKVYGKWCQRQSVVVEKRMERVESAAGGLLIPQWSAKRDVATEWHLAIDLVQPRDYFPDPTGRGMYEIQRIVKDLHELKQYGREAGYEQDVIAKLEDEARQQDQDAIKAAMMNQQPAPPIDPRKEVELHECWGTLLNEDGSIAIRSAVWTIANQKYVIRKPEPNPWWHGQSPFVVAPLLRVPGSVWHRALADFAVPLNVALNELFSLMIDGAFESVHGVKQVRLDFVERPEDLSGGIPPGTTIPVKAELPPGLKVLERVDQSAVPQDALAMFSILEKQLYSTLQVNDIKLGLLPSKQVKATEIVQAEQSISTFFDGIVRDLEDTLISPLLWKAWAVMAQEIQHLPLRYVPNDDIAARLVEIAKLKPEEQYLVMMQDLSITVRGLSGTLQRAKDFQKLMALLSAVSGSPVLLQAFFEEYNPSKILRVLMKWLNLDPTQIQWTEAERAQLAERMASLQQFANVTGRGSTSRMSAGGANLEAEINQTSNPLTGLVGGEG